MRFHQSTPILGIMNLYGFALLLFFVVASVAFYFGIFYTGTICDQYASGCIVRHTGAIAVIPVVVGVGFLTFGLFTSFQLWRAR